MALIQTHAPDAFHYPFTTLSLACRTKNGERSRRWERFPLKININVRGHTRPTRFACIHPSTINYQFR
jgi:hypothetical protein